MQTIQEPARQIPVVHQTDVLVVGSGPAGLAAALAAARPGSEVSLVDRFGCMGGNITAVGVEGFAWYRHEQTVEAGGIGMEFETRAKEMGAAVPESQSLSYELDSEGFKLVAGRSHGADRVAHAATCNMACCAVMGQGAGIAAALSLKSNQELHHLNLAPVHQELKRQGVRIH